MYKLCSELAGHTLDVRGVSHTDDGKILSCSRDSTARIWEATGNNFTLKSTLGGRSEFVSSICFVSPTKKHINGIIATGGNDALIMCYCPNTGKALFSLVGHAATVCCLATMIHSSMHLLSSSWDKTVRCWDLGSEQCLFTLCGHSQAVWCVMQLGCGNIISGSGDKTISCYTASGIYETTLVDGHTDCVRSFCALNDDDFVSAGNDGKLITWRMPEGIKLHTIIASNSYIYSLAYIKQIDTLVCGGESKGIYFYNRSEQLSSTLHIPAESVWSITVLPNSDVVVGCSDGIVRIYTKDYTRQAPESSRSPNNVCIPSETLSGPETTVKSCNQELIHLDQLGGPELLMITARHLEDMRIIREGFHAVFYLWNGLEWIEQGRKMGTYTKFVPTPNRKKYYTFSIDVEDGKPHLQLSIDAYEDPWDVANEFVMAHHLPQAYIKQIVDFLIRNMRDDFANSGTPEKENKYFPVSSFVKFDKSSPIVLSKLEEFNSLVEPRLRFDPKMLPRLKAVTEADSKDKEAIMTLFRLLSWPEGYLLPVLDLMRLSLRFSYANKIVASDGHGEKLIIQLLDCLSKANNIPNMLMSMRVLCNMLSHEPGLHCFAEQKELIMQCVKVMNVPPSPTPAFQIALSTLLLNLAVLSSKFPDFRSDCISTNNTMMRYFVDKEAVLRNLSMVGSIISFSGSNCIPSYVLAGILDHIQKIDIKNSHAEKCLHEIVGILVK